MACESPAAALRESGVGAMATLPAPGVFPHADAGTDVYFSADVETDGPIPGPYSMLSFGLAVAGTFDGKKFQRADPTAHTFYRELAPISDNWDQETLAVSGLDRSHLVTHGSCPQAAMSAAASWVRDQAGGGKPVLVAHPVAFDWAFLYWYYSAFSQTGSPFGYSSCLDIKTAYAIKAGVPIARAGLSRIPPFLRSGRMHTHRALDDAVEQADIFCNVFEWKPPQAEA